MKECHWSGSGYAWWANRTSSRNPWNQSTFAAVAISIESNSFASNCHMNQYANLTMYTSPNLSALPTHPPSSSIALSLSLSFSLSLLLYLFVCQLDCHAANVSACHSTLKSMPPTCGTLPCAFSWHFGVFNYLPIHQRVVFMCIVCLCNNETSKQWNWKKISQQS